MFLLVAMVAPFIWQINVRIYSANIYLAICGGCYLGYESLILLTRPVIDSRLGIALDATLLYLIPYSIVFAIGLRLPSMTRVLIWRLCLGAFFLFALMSLDHYYAVGEYVPTQKYKYPPTAYYLSFAVACSTLLWLLATKLISSIRSILLLSVIDFIAQNSIWIYLWHIPMVEMVHFEYIVKYAMVFLLAISVTFVQVTFLKKYILPGVQNVATKKYLLTIFTG